MAYRASQVSGQPLGAACQSWLAAAVGAAAEEKEGVSVGAADVARRRSSLPMPLHGALGRLLGSVGPAECRWKPAIGAACRAADKVSAALVPGGATAGEGPFPGGVRGWGRCGSWGSVACFCERGSRC